MKSPSSGFRGGRSRRTAGGRGAFAGKPGRGDSPGGAREGLGQQGVIVSHLGVAVEVELDDGARLQVRVQRRSGHVVGDRVRVEGERLTRLERERALLRRSPGGGEHVVAANLDLVVVVVAVEPPPRTGLIDRAVVAARRSGIAPAVCVNKMDVPGAEAALARLRRVFGPDIPVLGASAALGHGCDELATLIKERGRAVLTGHSGVGKSSLTNRLVGTELATKTLSEASGRGRHTTTASTLHRLPGGGELVDTPGIKEFGLVDVSAHELAEHFAGIGDLAREGCRFRDCLHQREPGCAVERAASEGRVDAARLESYRALLREVMTGEDPRA